jgi:hypothetical protein
VRDVWVFTALTSAFFDLDSGYALLATGGIDGIPSQWLLPFGPVMKNLPMITGTLLLVWTERQTMLRFVKGV